MMTPSLSRRGFLARAAAAIVGLLGGSVVGGLSTRAWARPLRDLRGGRLSVVGTPRSVVYVGSDEALRRERRAFQLPEFQSIIRDLISSGYKRSGGPTGADGVAGYMSEGGHVVSLRFVKDDGGEATAFAVARWWDHPRERCPHEEVMPDVFSREVVRGVAGAPSLLRFRYVDERGGLASKEEEFGPGSGVDLYCEPDCHTHPLGPCPTSCDNPPVCLHCRYATNVCSEPPPDCPECLLCAFCPGWPCGFFCTLTCDNVCNSTAEKYCCDYAESVCCPVDLSSTYPPSIPECL